LNEILHEISGERNVTPKYSLHLGSKLGSVGGGSLATAIMDDRLSRRQNACCSDRRSDWRTTCTYQFFLP